MKKVLLMSAAAAAIIFASCAKDGGNDVNNDAKIGQLSIKLSGVVSSRAVQDPGLTADGTIQLDNGHIFILNPLGDVTYNEALDPTEARTTDGQLLAQQVANDSRVFILGNIPAADAATITALTSLNAIKAAVSALSTQTDYAHAALSNSDGAPASISFKEAGTGANEGKDIYTTTVSIKPVISRIELGKVTGSGNITEFTVSGVYLDDYYPSFTYGASFSGTKYEQKQSTVFTGAQGDAGTWAAASLAAVPAAGKVWAHNVAAGSLPRFIIALEGVKYMDGATEVDLTGTTYYLTVTGYDGVTAFERGKIYRIGGDATNGSGKGIEFDEDDLGITPNPTDVLLMVKVSIDEWVLATPDAIL